MRIINNLKLKCRALAFDELKNGHVYKWISNVSNGSPIVISAWAPAGKYELTSLEDGSNWSGDVHTDHSRKEKFVELDVELHVRGEL